MFDKMKEEKIRREEQRLEEERIAKEKIEQEKSRLLGLNEKELLVEIIFILKGIERKHETLLEKLDEIDSSVTNIDINGKYDY